MSVQNTVSNNATHFLAATTVISKAHDEYKECSENWFYPTDIRLGTPKDEFYGEIWTAGMDWNITY
jgi:hypothetical protein